MRRSILCLLLCVAVGGLVALSANGASRGAAVIPINVRIGCNGEVVGEYSINNQTAELSKSAGDTARFQLLGNSDVSTVQVQPKENVAWPFVNDPPTFGRGNDAGTGQIDPNIAPGKYGYTFQVTCGSSPDVIDPDMDIKP